MWHNLDQLFQAYLHSPFTWWIIIALFIMGIFKVEDPKLKGWW